MATQVPSSCIWWLEWVLSNKLRKLFIWMASILFALALFIVSIYALLIVFDEVAYWRTLLRQGEYQKLDTVFSELESEGINPLKPLAWIFSREIHKRFTKYFRRLFL